MTTLDQIALALGYTLSAPTDTIAYPHWRTPDGHPVLNDIGEPRGEHETVFTHLESLLALWESPDGPLHGWRWSSWSWHSGPRDPRSADHPCILGAIPPSNVFVDRVFVEATNSFATDFAALTLAALKARKGTP